MPVTAREAAFRSLLRCEQSGSYTNLEIDSKIKKYGLEGPERAFYTALVYGVTERRITLDFRLRACVSGRLEDVDLPVLVILRIGAYQILYLDRVPQSAAVNEAVETARRHARAGAGKFVNAVLRTLCRTLDAPPDPPEDRLEALEAEFSVPRGLIALWENSYGEERAREILSSLSEPARVAVRVNTLKTTREELAASLEKEGVKTVPCGPDGSLILKDPGFPPALRRAVDEGLCFVQDISSQTAVAMLGPRPGELIADVCACPGGKSFCAALAMDGAGEIYSFDLHENKLSLVAGTAQKLGVGIISASARDARDPDPALAGRCDRVICDVPCSGFGVIAKKPEIRYRDPAGTERLPELQLEILRASSGYLRSGGRLLYSTCTLLCRENEEVVSAFLDGSPDFELISQRTFFPSRENDGFFAAVLERKR